MVLDVQEYHGLLLQMEDYSSSLLLRSSLEYSPECSTRLNSQLQHI